MICVRCENEEFALVPEAELEQDFRGETLKVAAPSMVCTKCGWTMLGPGQLDELRRRTADAYRKNHRLLTSAEIKGCREVLGMSQREFAEFLKVGEASVKRWETWQVQDQSSDELIRLKCELAKSLNLSGKNWTPKWEGADLVRASISQRAGKQKTVLSPSTHAFHIDFSKRSAKGKFVKLNDPYKGVSIASNASGFAKWCIANLPDLPVQRLQSGAFQWSSRLTESCRPQRQPVEQKRERKPVDYDPDLALAA